MDCIEKKNDDLKTLKAEGLAYIEEHLKPSRYEHTLRVRDESIRLAERFGGDREKAETAAIFHDMAKNLPPEEMDALVREFDLGQRYLNHPNLAHSKLAACLMRRDFGVTDPELLNAVASHTTGRPGMGTVEKIVFLADAIEPGRNYPSIGDIRALADVDLDEACVLLLELTIEYLELKGTDVDSDTIDALEYMRSVVEAKKSEVYDKESENLE